MTQERLFSEPSPVLSSSRVLVCGARDWDDAPIVRAVLDGLWRNHACRSADPFVVIEGAADGADAAAGEWAATAPGPANIWHLPFPAEWPPKGSPKWQFAKAGNERNERMLAEGNPHLVVAFKDRLAAGLTKGGTEHMIRIAREAGVPVYHVSRIE